MNAGSTPSNANESYCTFTLAPDVTVGGLPSQEEIAKDLESTDANVKKHALKAAIMAMLSGESMPRILMQVIRFCINSQDKQLKKLCMLYWEVVPKYQEPTPEQVLAAAAGGPPVVRKMLPEMLLVCNALLQDLNHPNEYVRGSMLRFLCKIKDEEILGPLIPAIKACLEHRHPYVRKNAALTVFHAHRMFGETLIPDGPELILHFIEAETDTAARRNAFLMLFKEAEELAFQFLAKHMDQVGKYGDGFSLLVLELTRQVCRRDPAQKSRFVRVLFSMLGSASAAVSYEAAWTLTSLSSAPTAIRAAALTYTNLLNGQNDNNVKLIVLERLEGLKAKHHKIVQELLMDILRALSSPNPDICQKVLSVAMDVVSAKNVGEVVAVLKREVSKTLTGDDEAKSSTAYRNLLIKTIHGCAVRFPAVAESVVHTLMELVGTDSGLQVILFVRAIMEQYPALRSPLLAKLVSSLDEMTSNQVLCVSLWILGEYSETADAIEGSYQAIVEQAGQPPFLIQPKDKEAAEKEAAAAAAAPKMVTKNVVLSDGTYATQTVYSEPQKPAMNDSTPSLRKLLIGGDVFLGETLAVALTKLCLRGETLGVSNVKAMVAQSVVIMCGVVKMAEVTVAAQRSSLADCQERLTLCVRTLLDPAARALVSKSFLEDGRARFAQFLKILKEKELKEAKKAAAAKSDTITTQADDLIHFRQLKSANDVVDLDDDSDLARATGYNSSSLLSSELSHVYQLSGFADPVYSEALVTVHDYDIVLEILVINRTPNTLANLTVELSTLGDMKLVERPQSTTLGPLEQVTIRASIKVSSTETGHIFGTIVYDDATTREKVYVNLNDIHMDIMDYIRPATCTDEAFRAMWAEFEWENKVAISTSIASLIDFLNHIVTSTNMRCLTPHDKTEKGSFLAANLYARR
uniref:Coatomer subunit beta n=1 Tax=Amphora coffeiformis TaxID=265554 RepID=A0A7S3L9L6_9STRA